jgi:hypothetical protein
MDTMQDFFVPPQNVKELCRENDSLYCWGMGINNAGDILPFYHQIL